MYSILRWSTSLVVVTLLGSFGCGERGERSVQPTNRRSLESARVSAPTEPPTESPTMPTPAIPDSQVLVNRAAVAESPNETAAAPILKVAISGAKSSQGVYFCALFDDEEKLKQREDPVQAERFPASEAEVVWTIDSLPLGEYSIAVFHDANENDVLDRHALGFPIEAYGFSRNARGKFGPPPYDQIKFSVSSGPQELQIHVK